MREVVDQRVGAGELRIALRRGGVLKIGETEMVGSNDGMVGPSCVTMPPPELTPLPPPLEGAPLVLTLTPVRLTLVGPARDALTNAAQQSAALGAPQHFAREQRAIALHFDIDIVFERERNHVLSREIKIARADERLEARRIRQIDRAARNASDRDASASQVRPLRDRFGRSFARERRGV